MDAPTTKKKADLRERLAGLLSSVEAELAHADAADDQIGAHAEHARAAIGRDLGRRRTQLGAVGNDPGREAEYLRILGHADRAATVGRLAAEARRRRGGG